MRKENFTLSKRLKQYSALAGSMLAVVGVAHGQVLYTDIPDAVLPAVNPYPGDAFALDLNNDGTTDFNFLAWKSSSSTNTYAFGLLMDPPTTANPAGIIGTYATTGNHQGIVSELALNHSIGTNPAAFFKFSNILYNTTQYVNPLLLSFSNGVVTNGVWQPGDTSRYVGLEFNFGGGTHYGWARLDVAPDASSITIRDYACDLTADEPLFAGQGSPLGVSPVKQPDNFNILGYEGVATIFVNDGKTDGCIVSVTNMLGETIIRQTLTNRTTRIDLNQYAKGIYLVSVQRGAESFSKKISLR